jgi:hypothetical protein
MQDAIEVTTDGLTVVGFTWRGRSYAISEMLEAWVTGHEVGYRGVAGQVTCAVTR